MKLDEAVAIFDKSAARTKPNAQTEAWTVIRDALAQAVKDAEMLVFLADADNAADAGIYGISIGQTVDDLRARIAAAIGEPK